MRYVELFFSSLGFQKDNGGSQSLWPAPSSVFESLGVGCPRTPLQIFIKKKYTIFYLKIYKINQFMVNTNYKI